MVDKFSNFAVSVVIASSHADPYTPEPRFENLRFSLTDISIQQLLDHMRESMVYSEADLGPFQKRLEDLRQIVKDDAANNPPAMIELLERKLNQCGMCYLCSFCVTCPTLS
jgi:hypothetical protein